MKRGAIIVAVVLAAALFALALQQLFSLRFASGDVYPAYSSFRADPLGTRAFHESLGLMPRVQVDRLTGPMPTTGVGAGDTLFVLGADSALFHDVPESDAKELETFARGGGRVVIAFSPDRSRPLKAVFSAGAGTNAGPAARKGRRAGTTPGSKPAPKPGGARFHEVSLRERWSFDVDYVPLEVDEQEVVKPVEVVRAAEAPGVLPQTLNWHSAAVFSQPGADWRTIYEREGKPVAMERDWGRGTLLLLTDSYPFSNEALRVDRQAALLSWCTGPVRRVYFDETHLGVEEDPGVATLARRYRLHGFAFGLVVVLGLFVWRTAPAFLPRAGDEARDGAELAGRDAAAGFVNLLRRGIEPDELFTTCYEEWRRTAVADGVSGVRMDRARSRYEAEMAKAPSERNVLAAYREIAEAIAPRQPWMAAAKPKTAVAVVDSTNSRT